MESGNKINFIERVDLVQEFHDALVMAREATEFLVGSDTESFIETAQYIYPKLRFVWLNSLRYVFASRFLRDEDFVIDVPCGTGYGAAILASNGNSVLGIDIDKGSIDRARDMFRFPNMSFEVGDMTKMHIPQADFITCLDGLEHVADGEELIQRFVGVLSDKGILVITVPINEQWITGGEQNPYHMADYTPEKLDSLLSRYFTRVTYFGHDMYGSISDLSNAFDGIMAVCEV